ncbi:MAG: HAMP domain-containing protein, partial [Pseudomonadota bacterium]
CVVIQTEQRSLCILQPRLQLQYPVVLGVAGYFSYKYIERAEQQELSELAEVSANRLAKHLVIPMWNVDREQVSELLEAEMQEQRVAAIVVRDEDKSTLFAAKDRDDGGSVIDSIGSISGNYTSVDRDILNGDKNIGVVSIFVTPQYLQDELTKFRQGVIATLILLNLLIFLIMMLVLGRLLINPLMTLASGAEKISRGELNQTFDINTNDEIGYLASTFNKMQSSLRVAIRRLTKATPKA